MQLKQPSILLSTLLGLALLLAAFSPALAQTPSPGLEMQAQAAFEGNFKFGEWVPIWVSLQNSGADLSGQVIVRVSGSGGNMVYAAPVDLPGGARKRLPIYVLPNNFTRLLSVQYEAGNQVLAKQNVPVQPQINASFFIGLISPQRGALTLLNGLEFPGIKRQVVLLDMQLSELPPRSQAMRSLDVLVLNSSDTSQLTAEQAEAIHAWVRQGGRLVIGGGALAQETVSGLQALPLPLEVASTQQISSAAGLQTIAGEDQPQPPTGDFIAAVGQLSPQARLLAGDALTPLVVENQMDKGAINLVTLDLAEAPFEGWSGASAFWQNLFGPSAAYPTWLPPDLSSRQQMASQMGYALQNLPMLDLPSVAGLAALLGLYILIIGPINYLVLRWKKRLHWAWITIPVITLIFSLSAFGLGYAMHGADIFVNKIGVIEISPGGSSHTSFVGLFSPAQSSYQIDIPGNGLISPMSPYYNPWDSFGQDNPVPSSNEVRLLQSDPASIRGLSVEQWSMQSFMIEGLSYDFGAIEHDLSLQGATLTGQVHNKTQYPLSDLTLIFNHRFQRLGDLPAGESLSVELDLSGFGEPTFGSPVAYQIYEDQFNNPSAMEGRAVEVKRIMLETLFQSGNPLKSSWNGLAEQNSSLSQSPVLVGWLSDAPPQVSVNGEMPAQQSTAMVFSQMDYQIAVSDPMSLPIGLIPGSLTIIPSEGGSCGDAGSLAVYIYRGEAEFNFNLAPELLALQLSHLNLGIWNDSGMLVLPTITIFDFEEQAWTNLDNLSIGENTIPDPAAFVDANGLVRIRLNANQDSQGCFYVGLGLEAHTTEP